MPLPSWPGPGSVVWFVAAHLAISGCTLALLTLRRRVGVGWLWLWVGALSSIMWLAYAAGWRVAGPGEQHLFFGSGFIAPSFLMLMLLVYLEHGARDARRMLLGIAASGVLFQIFFQLARAEGVTTLQRITWQMVIAEPMSLGAALALMSVLYQLSLQLRLALPVSLRFFLALLLGIAVDTVLFPVLGFGDFRILRLISSPTDFALAKLFSALLLTLPAAFYLQRQARAGRRLAVQDMGPLSIAALGREGPVPDFEVWRSMAETLGDGMTAAVGDHLVFANAAMARIAGYERAEELTGLPLERLVAPEDLERVLTEQRARQEGAVSEGSYEWRLRRPDGTGRILATTATPALLGAGRVVIGIHRDVTDEREMQAQVEASNLAVHALMAGASSLVASLNTEKIVAAVAEQAGRLVGSEFVVFLEKVPGHDRFRCRHIEGAASGILVGEELSREETAYFGHLPRSGGRHALPLLADGQELGMLVVALREEGRTFTWNELALLDALGAMGAAALRTSQLVAGLRGAEQRYAMLFDQVPTPVFLYQLDSLRISAGNQAASRRYGWPAAEFLQRSMADLLALPEREASETALRRAAPGRPALLQRHRDRQGEEFDVMVNIAEIELAGSRWGLAACVDLTLERRNQERRQVSQRLESLGRLAGGIAHDFNNILTALQVDLDLLGADYRDQPALHNELAHVRGAVERAADLTRQILLFSRGEEPKRRPVRVNEAVRAIERLLMRSLGETAELVVQLAPEDPRISADVSQLQLALVNLCLNGRDAMPHGGVLRVTTSQVRVDDEMSARLGMSPGRAALLTVVDTGIGMSPEVLERALEPFFTTKKAERGTGLGLSIVHGVVRAHGGAVEMESRPGEGTRVLLYFPELEAADADPEASAPQATLHGRGTVLLVDDETAIRRAGRRMLERYGYRVLLAEDGEAALRELHGANGAVDLVLTDLVMPRMDALGLVEVIRREWPGLPVVLSTGYDDGRLGPGQVELFSAFVSKPYTPNEMLQTVREVLDAARGAGSGKR